MRIVFDPLVAAAGFSCDVPEDQADDVRRLLVEEAKRFLRAGQRVTIDEWARLGAPSRAAFVVALEELAGAPAPSTHEPAARVEDLDEPRRRVNAALEDLAARAAA